jgi:hypothetical protein
MGLSYHGMNLECYISAKRNFSSRKISIAFRLNPKSSVKLSYLGTALPFRKYVNLCTHLDVQYKLDQLQLSIKGVKCMSSVFALIRNMDKRRIMHESRESNVSLCYYFGFETNCNRFCHY